MKTKLHLFVAWALLLVNLPAVAQTTIDPPSPTEPSMNETSASLGYVILFVKDVSASLTFYEDAFGFTRRFFNDDNGKAYGELDTGAARLAFYSLKLVKAELELPEVVLASAAGPPLGFEIAVLTTDVPGLFTRAVKAGATVVSEPVEKPWGQTGRASETKMGTSLKSPHRCLYGVAASGLWREPSCRTGFASPGGRASIPSYQFTFGSSSYTHEKRLPSTFSGIGNVTALASGSGESEAPSARIDRHRGRPG